MYMPPFEKLEKAGKEELLKIIRGTKSKMTRLRNVMEHPDYKNRTEWVDPSDDVIYKCDREFLNLAIIKYLSLGGEYSYSKSELNDTEFNDNLENISKIIFYNGTCFSIPQKIVVDLSGKELNIQVGDFANTKSIETTYDKENFLYELGELHIGEWRHYYDTKRFGIAVLDGVQWFLEIQYKNGKKKKYAGSNAFPYNYDDLISLFDCIGMIKAPFLGEIET